MNFRFKTAGLAVLVALFCMQASAQILSGDTLKKVVPTTYFFAGQSAAVQTRNSVALKSAGGHFVLAGLVDTSGYSTAIQEKYQGFFITESKLTFDGATLEPGEYGFGFKGGKFLVMNVASTDLLSAQHDVDLAIREGKTVVTDDAFLLARSTEVDVLVDVTGSVEFGARVAFEAFKHGKDVVLMNAEIDATIGPILQVYAAKHGVIFSACDGDEPGVQINLYRWVKGLGLTPRVIGNIKGLQDPYRNPTTQKGFAEKWGQNPAMVTSFADGSKISFEQAIVANATGFKVHVARHVARHGIQRRRHEDRQAL